MAKIEINILNLRVVREKTGTYDIEQRRYHVKRQVTRNSNKVLEAGPKGRRSILCCLL